MGLQKEVLTGTPVFPLFYYYEKNWRSRIYGESKGVTGRPIYFSSIENSVISHVHVTTGKAG
jgi:hypothetical protein